MAWSGFVLRASGANGTRILLEVADDGPGIPSEIAPRIFDPFFTTKAPDIGTGLGLSIVYGIIRQHDGEVTFESEPATGAKFIVELPVVSPPAEMPKQPAAESSEEESESKPASRILVVEDEPTVACLIVDVLQEEGYRVTSVLDSREGLDSLSHRSYDLVICDLRMPHIDGRSFFRALQRSRNPMQWKVLFITGDTMSPPPVANSWRRTISLSWQNLSWWKSSSSLYVSSFTRRFPPRGRLSAKLYREPPVATEVSRNGGLRRMKVKRTYESCRHAKNARRMLRNQSCCRVDRSG